MTKKTVWVILRSSVHNLPPVMSLLQTLSENNEYNVAFISSISANIKNSKNNYKEYINTNKPGTTLLSKALQYIKFRNFTQKIIIEKARENDVMWIGSLDTALTLKFSSVLDKIPYILQLHELYDTFPIRRKLIAPIARAAKSLVTPELNRAAILQIWLKLKERPKVIPNKPYKHPRKNFLAPTTEKTRQIIDKFWKPGKSIILYQGHIGGDRNLTPLAEAMRDFPDMELWLLGHDHGYASTLEKISSNIKYLGYVPAPLHLEITSYASIGVLNYDPINLNNLYCAPNKIWEYSGFGIPFIGNDSIVLTQIANNFHSGITCNFNASCISESLIHIINNNDSLASNSAKFYESVDLKNSFYEVLI